MINDHIKGGKGVALKWKKEGRRKSKLCKVGTLWVQQLNQKDLLFNLPLFPKIKKKIVLNFLALH